jgi:hypothetical protein
LSLDGLAFDPQDVIKYEVSYMALSRIHLQEQLYLLHLVCSKNFHVDQSISNEMSRLIVDTKYKILVPLFFDIRKDNIILQSLNTQSLSLHYKVVLVDSNLMPSHVLCLNETIISSLQAHPNLHTTLLKNFNVLSCYDNHGTILLFWKDMILYERCTFGFWYIIHQIFFNGSML